MDDADWGWQSTGYLVSLPMKNADVPSEHDGIIGYTRHFMNPLIISGAIENDQWKYKWMVTWFTYSSCWVFNDKMLDDQRLLLKSCRTCRIVIPSVSQILTYRGFGCVLASIVTAKLRCGFLRKTTHFFLVGGLEHFLFSHILGIIIPID